MFDTIATDRLPRTPRRRLDAAEIRGLDALAARMGRSDTRQPGANDAGETLRMLRAA